MKNDSSIKVLLIIITTLLALNLMIPIFSNPEISYAAKNVEYKIVYKNDESKYNRLLVISQDDYNRMSEKITRDEKILNELGKEGWELIYVGSALLIFKR